MSNTKKPDQKKDALRCKGSLHRQPQRVTDLLFLGNEFFDPRDLVQVKYEMLRRVRAEGKSVTQAAGSFGMSRFSFYQAQAAFRAEGLPGLVPKKPGPHGRHKMTAEVMAWMEGELAQDASLRARDVLSLMKKRFGFTVHRRTIERALEVSKKKRR